jgi:Mg2+ and Co2+ transporter CorA
MLTEEQLGEEVQKQTVRLKAISDSDNLLRALIEDYANVISKIEGTKAKEIEDRIFKAAGKRVVDKTTYL